MPDELGFGAAILVGLLGSSHCLGMCGGIVNALNLGAGTNFGNHGRGSSTHQLAYNAGRILSYVLVGLLAGIIGSTVLGAGVATEIGQLIAAAFMIALGLYRANWWRGLVVFEKLGAHLWRQIEPLGKRLYPTNHIWKSFLLGMIWGWLPCGLVYAVAAWSLTTADPGQAALVMLGFGIGTLPAMLSAGKLLTLIRHRVQTPALRRLAGVSVILFGLYAGYGSFSDSNSHHHHAQPKPITTTVDQAATSSRQHTPAS